MNYNKIYKKTYESDKWGGNTRVTLTIEFVNLKKLVEGSENIQWVWDLILDEKREIIIWRDEDNKGRQYDGGCYYLEKDEYGNRVLGEPLKDWEERDIIEEYLNEVWSLQKREEYIRIEELKAKLTPSTKETFGSLIDEL